jgi:hypothetical protein
MHCLESDLASTMVLILCSRYKRFKVLFLSSRCTVAKTIIISLKFSQAGMGGASCVQSLMLNVKFIHSNPFASRGPAEQQQRGGVLKSHSGALPLAACGSWPRRQHGQGEFRVAVHPDSWVVLAASQAAQEHCSAQQLCGLRCG